MTNEDHDIQWFTQELMWLYKFEPSEQEELWNEIKETARVALEKFGKEEIIKFVNMCDYFELYV